MNTEFLLDKQGPLLTVEDNGVVYIAGARREAVKC